MLEPVVGTRMVASPDTLDAFVSARDAVVLRIAADEALVLGSEVAALDDPHAIVETDTGWSAVSVETPRMLEFLRHAAAWEVPSSRPTFVQGMVAGIAAKILIEDGRSLLVVPRAFGAEMTDRLPEAWAR